MFRLFPLLIIPVVIYNLLAFGGGVVHHDVYGFLAHTVTLPLFSGETWKVSNGDFLILLTLALLFFEIIRATHTSTKEMINHGLSMLTFVVALVEFITLKGFATSVFFFVMAMALFDTMAGYTISVVAAKHDLNIGRTGS